VKNTFCFTALGAALMLLSSLSAAQNVPLFNVHSMESGEDAHPIHPTLGPPKYCSPCLFYGGDWNNPDPNWESLADFDGQIYKAAMYTPFSVPRGKTWIVTAIFANVGFFGFSKMDPAKAEWSINSGMHSGSPGKVIASGKTQGTAKPTGRKASTGRGEMIEYTVAVKLPKAVKLTGGKTYWESVVPPCNNTHDRACQFAAAYETDTFDNTHKKQGAHAFGPKQPLGLAFDNAPYFDAHYYPINPAFCIADYLPGYACNYWSAGVIGTEK
jgi:hypothetical protein